MKEPDRRFQEPEAPQFSLWTTAPFRERLGLKSILPSPCTQACPAGVNVKGYVGLIAAGRFPEALELVRRANPFPAICGRVCHHPCESFCRRAEIDEPVAICGLKRFIADYEIAAAGPRVDAPLRWRAQTVAVIGSGPAGLTAASDLARMGFGVSVFEAHREAGGMLVLGIPEYRLPREVIRYEIQRILDLGVELRTGVRVGRDFELRELRQEKGFDAVFVAVGAHLPRRLGIPGEKGEGLEDCLDFMGRVNSATPIEARSRVLVLGGGHSALDCARSAVRLGCARVRLVYRRSRAEMPAGETEVSQAEQEGVRFTFLASPVRVIRRQGKLRGLELIRTRLGDPDSSGRRRPLEVPGSEFRLEADLILSAVGQKPNLEMGEGSSRLSISSRGTVRVEGGTLATSQEGVFAGGDAVTGPGTVIEAIAQGHRAAASIACYLDPAARPPARENRCAGVSWELELGEGSSPPSPRITMPQLPAGRRQRTFREVNLGFSQEMAVKEAQRCLRCGPCSECSLCVTSCPKRQLLLSVGGAGDSWEALVRVDSNDPTMRRFSGSSPVRLNREETEPGSWPGREARLSELSCRVDSQLCRGCGVCEENCGYGAIQLRPGGRGSPTAEVLTGICKGCGVCVAVCPTGAVRPGCHTDTEIIRRLELGDSSTTVFTCRWNPLAAGLAAVPSGTSIVPVLCAGRLHPGLVLRAFQSGAQKVAVLVCEPQRCHYGFGSHVAAESLQRTGHLLHLLGIDPSRLRVMPIGVNPPNGLEDLLADWPEGREVARA